MLATKKSDQIFASTLELIEQAGSRDRYSNERQQIPIYGSFVVSPDYPSTDSNLARIQDSNVKFHQVILLNTTEKWTARLATSEIIHNKTALYDLTPILTMKLRSGTYLTVGLSFANIRSAYVQLATKLPSMISANKFIGLNYKFTAFRQIPTFVSMGCWVSTSDGSAVMELKSSLKSYASATYKRPISKSITSFIKLTQYRHLLRPQVDIGVEYTANPSCRIQGYTSVSQSVVKLCVNAILRLNDTWKTYLQVEVREDKIFFNLGFQNKSFYLQIPIFYQNLVHVADKLAVLLIGGLVLTSIVRVSGMVKANSQINPDMKHKTPAERLKKQKKVLSLMEQRIKENYKHEEDCQGLIVIEGYYGRAEDIQALKAQQFKAQYHLVNNLQVVDVTLSLVFWTKASQIHLFAKPKKDLIGFCDPCEMENTKKLLYVRYQYKGVVYENTFQDHECVDLPNF